MEPINLHLFDLEHFQKHLNRHLAHSEERGISFRNPKRKDPKKTSFQILIELKHLIE